MKLKVLLVVPPSTFNFEENYYITFPLGIAYIAAVLEKEHKVEILDCLIERPEANRISKDEYHVGLFWGEIRERIKKADPDIVGISCSYSTQYKNACRTAEIAKNCRENIFVVTGGAHPSALPGDTLKNSNFDAVVIGEGEQAMKELSRAVKDKKPYESIDGLAYKKGEKIIINPKRNYIKDIDEIPFPAWHLFSMEKYLKHTKDQAFFSRRKPVMSMITSRGCPGHCTFCSIHSVWGNTWRSRSADNVVMEIKILAKKYGVREIHFQDDNMTLDRKRMINICRGITEKNLDIAWTNPNGVAIKTLNREVLFAMKRAGCYRLSVAVESGNYHVLHDIIKKDLVLEEVRPAIKIMKELGIEVMVFFVIGMPDETKEQVMDSIRFAKGLDADDVLFSIASPYPGSELYRKYCNDLINVDYSKLKPKFSVFSTENFSSAELERIRNRAYFEFQLNKLIKHPFSYLTKKQNYVTLRRYTRFFVLRIIKKIVGKFMIKTYHN